MQPIFMPDGFAGMKSLQNLMKPQETAKVYQQGTRAGGGPCLEPIFMPDGFAGMKYSVFTKPNEISGNREGLRDKGGRAPFSRGV